MRATVVGAGSWGTALGCVLAVKGWDVVLWDVDTEPLEQVSSRHENARYLPGIQLPPTLRADPDLGSALAGTDLLVLSVPSTAVRGVATLLLEHPFADVPIVSATKGVETDTLMTMSEVLEDVLPEEHHHNLAFLSGPSFAVEVARGLPTAVTIAARHEETARAVQVAFHTGWFRPYTTDDVVGVEIGGCTKNVVAIACGLADGMGFEANARAALVTRGLAEISRLAIARGAEPLTLAGLSGMGDLMLTCTSEKSRNYRVGHGLGEGRPLEEVQAELGQVAEGVVNAASVRGLARSVGVDMPISEAVYRLIYEGLTPDEAYRLLLGRDLKPER
jgi:glycerol-3-phosphate dehydrogenase (NAD(P)+)